MNRRLDPTNADPDNVVHRVEKTVEQIRAAMETPYEDGGAGYARSQYRIVLQSYPSPIPRGTEFAYPEAVPIELPVPAALAAGPVGLAFAGTISNGRLVLGCPFWDADATWARDTLVPQLSDALGRGRVPRGCGLPRPARLPPEP